MAAKICASVVVDNAKLIKEQAQTALSSGADFVEIRFDFLRPDQMAAAIDEAKDLRSRAVYTLRSKNQGGRFAGSEPERVDWLRRLAEQRPMLIDVELETLKNNDDLADFLERSKTSVMVSWHDFEKTPPTDEIADILSEMRVYSNYVKIVTMARSTEDSLRLLSMYANILDLHPVIFGMGDAGVISRVLCTVVGNAPFTYASVGDSVAQGQLTVTQMRKLYDSMTISS
ncbi:MAG: type I 3-dehydroquinate dehydratase [Nitrososphaera sp.]|nr:type I 3-dehydroquinate dehydratase [Nitrososphaera sp.]